MKKLIINRCQCRKCGYIIESKHRHDFVSCSCGAIFADGGRDYIRRGFKDPDDIIDMSEYWDDGEDDEKYPGISADADDWGII